MTTESTAVLEAPEESALRAYGYMRVPSDIPDYKVRVLEKAVIAYTEARGYQFVSFFFEFHCGTREAFDDLVAELVATDSHFVVVPSLNHLAKNLFLQDMMLDHLACIARAKVLAMRIKTLVPYNKED